MSAAVSVQGDQPHDESHHRRRQPVGPVRRPAGRVFRIEAAHEFHPRKTAKELSHLANASIAVRNFPLSAADLRKRLKLQDGGDIFIFATTVAESGNQLFICRKAR